MNRKGISFPLYKVLQKRIEDFIKEKGLNPGDPIPPERELCKEFGVSRSSLRRAITNLVNNGKLVRIPGKGTFVAESQKKSNQTFRSGNIGFVVLFTTLDRERSDIGKSSLEGSGEKISWIPFYFEVFEGVREELAENGLHLLFFVGYQDSSSDISNLRSFLEKVDGAIVCELSDKNIVSLFEKPNFPVVLLNPSIPFFAYPGIDFFTIDNIDGAYQATIYLISLGHRKIGLINHPTHHNYPAKQRLQGYKMALKKAGIQYEEQLVAHGNWSMESGYEAMKSLLKSNTNLTSVFATNDEMAIGAMKAIREQNLRIPEDISVVGFDDSPASNGSLTPLTTVRVHRKEMGRHAVRRIVQQLNRFDSLSLRVTFPTELIIRNSCTKPKSSQ